MHSISVNLKNSQSLTDLPKSVAQMADANMKAVPAAAGQITNNGMCVIDILSTGISIQILLPGVHLCHNNRLYNRLSHKVDT